MTRPLTWRGLIAAAGVAGMAFTQAGASAQQLTISLNDALSLYAVGEFDVVSRALQAAGGGDAEHFLPEFKKSAAAWIEADGPSQAPHRRLVAATFALEIGYAGLDVQFEMTRQLSEWACELMRTSRPPTEAERQLMLGELALLEATFQTDPSKPGELTLKHLAHIRSRFPQEPRVDLAKALIEENMYWRGRLQPTNGRVFIDESVTKAAITSLELAAKRPENGPEAHLRLGYLEYARGHLEDALTHLSAAALGDDDPTRLYVAYLTIGRTHEKAGRMPEAIDAFRKALAAVNGLSAALALAVRLYDINERDEADAIVEAALSLGPTARDPWKQYGYGDLRRWPAIIAKLREQAQ